MSYHIFSYYSLCNVMDSIDFLSVKTKNVKEKGYIQKKKNVIKLCGRKVTKFGESLNIYLHGALSVQIEIEISYKQFWPTGKN